MEFELEYYKQVKGVDFDLLELVLKKRLFTLSEMEYDELFTVVANCYRTPLEVSDFEVYAGGFQSARLSPATEGYVQMVISDQRAMPYFSVWVQMKDE